METTPPKPLPQPALDAVEEQQETVAEQSEDEIAFSGIDEAADRRKLDRVIDILSIVSRSRRLGAESFPLTEKAQRDVSLMVSAASRWTARYFDSDLPRLDEAWD